MLEQNQRFRMQKRKGSRSRWIKMGLFMTCRCDEVILSEKAEEMLVVRN